MTVDPAGGDSAEVDEVRWDEVVDLICVGPGDTATAVALAAEDAGLEVYLTGRASARVGEQTLAARMGLHDAATVDYLTALTDDTGPLSGPDVPAELAGDNDVAPWEPPYHFSGGRLRDWAIACLASPYGVLSTAPAGFDVAPWIVGAVDAADVHAWLAGRAAVTGLHTSPESVLERLVFSGGRVAGAVLGTAVGQRWVKGTRAVVLATGTAVALPTLSAVCGGELAVVTHPMSRFARLGLL